MQYEHALLDVVMGFKCVMLHNMSMLHPEQLLPSTCICLPIKLTGVYLCWVSLVGGRR